MDKDLTTKEFLKLAEQVKEDMYYIRDNLSQLGEAITQKFIWIWSKCGNTVDEILDNATISEISSMHRQVKNTIKN